MVDYDQVAFLPAVMLPAVRRRAEEAVPESLDHVQPGFARMPVQRLRLARSELDHHLRDAGGLAADGTVDQELGPRAARRGQELLLVVRRVNAAAAALSRFLGEAPEAARIRVIAFGAVAESRTRRQIAHLFVAAILEQAHAERPQHRLRGVAHEARRLFTVVAVAMPAPGGQVDRVPRLPFVARAAGGGLGAHRVLFPYVEPCSDEVTSP